MVRKIIDQYVDDVVRQLPVSRRKQAEKKLRGAIYEMLAEYTDGEKPVSRDARAVLRELGSPDEVADSYYRQRKRPKGNRGKITAETVARFTRLLMILSAVFVSIGILLIVTRITSNTALVFAGGHTNEYARDRRCQSVAGEEGEKGKEKVREGAAGKQPLFLLYEKPCCGRYPGTPVCRRCLTSLAAGET